MESISIFSLYDEYDYKFVRGPFVINDLHNADYEELNIYSNLYDNQWLALMADRNVIVGFYYGEVYTDIMGRLYSKNSYINIRPEYRGKGLCEKLAKYAYNQVYNVFGVDYMTILVASKIRSGACRCYVKSALFLNFDVYMGYMGNTPVKINHYSECTDETKNIIFVIKNKDRGIDQIMLIPFDIS